jgi:GT2 family glycosyltransferase
VTAPRVSAVVLAYGKSELLRGSLAALQPALQRVAGGAELIVVINSLDPADRLWLEESCDCTIVDPGENLGFAAGVNAGIEHARGIWVALVNDDCVVEPTALAELLAAGEQADDIGSVAARIEFSERPGTINSAGIEVDILGVAIERLLGSQSTASETDVVEVFGVSGACGLFRRSMLEAIGGFDESFFAYLEDADVAWRARMAGWRSVYAPAALVRHHHSSSLGHVSASKQFLVGRNRIRMLAKNATTSQLRRHWPRMVAYDVAYVVFATVATRTSSALQGRLAGLRHWRAVRRSAADTRVPVELAAPAGLGAAVRRWGSYRG